ncbi:YIP1 family protein [Salipiger sp. P9]|uniref:YIP1 family protein n=1 Tax=Salipiger pentaromativorans TaxID=2943193 RepID=UPI002157FA03|nr:YIP1 family protein [Salipiger pentaromativorans]MCR8546972.1 YIP1 family protein [Salipiger pentaromativorans]
MTGAALARLAWQTLVAPREVAQTLLSLRLSQETILTALALVVVLNALVIGAMQAAGLTGAAVPVMLGPLPIAALLAAMLTASILFMTWAGRLMGGQGRSEDVALLLAWLQGLRVVAQLVVAVASVLSGALASLAVVATLIAGTWILINFLDVAHGFGNLFRALMVLVFGSVLLIFALTVIFSLLGVSPNGMAV